MLVNDLRQGAIFEQDGELYQVADFRRHKMARAKAVVNIKARNIKTNSVREFTFKSTASVGDADVVTQSLSFIYYDNRKGELVLSDPETKKRLTVSANVLSENEIAFLSEGALIIALTNGRSGNELEIYSVSLPKTVDLKVVQAPPAEKGNTSSGGTKSVETESGLMVNTPFFIKNGDVIRVNTQSGEYIERVSE